VPESSVTQQADGLTARIEPQRQIVAALSRPEPHLAPATAIGDEIADVHAADDHLERRLAIELADPDIELPV
jgi:hypothetical protein